MDNLAILARREYQREWRKKNKERVKAYNADYWQKQAEKKVIERRNAEGSGVQNGKGNNNQ